MVKTSIIIPFKNDWDDIYNVVSRLREGIPSDCEIVIVNDGSYDIHGKPKSVGISGVKEVVSYKQYGVGYSFDRGVENCRYENIVLMGADVFPHEGWYDKVTEAIAERPESIGCAVCVGNKEPYTRRYGAKLLFAVGVDDLPEKSKLRERQGGYTDLFKGKWINICRCSSAYDIPCLMGAFYFTTKSYYNKIHGWDTENGNGWCGHRAWGHLEPYLSLKSWLYGGGCYLDPFIEATHIFSRTGRHNRWDKGKRSADDMHWNSVFMLETMILDDDLRKKIYDFKTPELNFNIAKKRIAQHYPEVIKTRERNAREFKYNHTIFTDKFGYTF